MHPPSHVRRCLRRLVPALAAGALVAGCSSLRLERHLAARPDDWPTFARTTVHTAAASCTLAPPLTLAWTQDVSAGTGNGSPVVMDSIVFVGTLRGELFAISAATGKSFGSISLGDAIEGSPVIDANVAYVAYSHTPMSLVALDLIDGHPRWKMSYGDVEVTPCLYGGRLFLGNTEGTFFCTERITGAERWRFRLPDNTALKGIRSSAAADSGAVVFGAEDGKIYALNAETGALRWAFDTGAPVEAAPLITAGKVIAGNLHGILCAVDLRTGQSLWESPTGAPVYANAVPAGDLVVVGNLAGSMSAFRLSDGMKAWRTDLEGPVNSGAVLSGNTLYVGTMKKLVYGLDAQDGAVTWKVEAGGRIRTSPAVAFGCLFVTTDEHDLLAYREAQ
ncbi:MAG TPA: PQQ-binding-like beta-propeller repeat protein [Bacteroidota bacterium]|nr:PQQ-binding-like beta-propeller repeat protein [Bacteroidota bacterium]